LLLFYNPNAVKTAFIYGTVLRISSKTPDSGNTSLMNNNIFIKESNIKLANHSFINCDNGVDIGKLDGAQ